MRNTGRLAESCAAPVPIGNSIRARKRVSACCGEPKDRREPGGIGGGEVDFQRQPVFDGRSVAALGRFGGRRKPSRCTPGHIHRELLKLVVDIGETSVSTWSSAKMLVFRTPLVSALPQQPPGLSEGSSPLALRRLGRGRRFEMSPLWAPRLDERHPLQNNVNVSKQDFPQNLRVPLGKWLWLSGLAGFESGMGRNPW